MMVRWWHHSFSPVKVDVIARGLREMASWKTSWYAKHASAAKLEMVKYFVQHQRRNYHENPAMQLYFIPYLQCKPEYKT